MKSYYCPHLYNEINFDVEKVMICAGMSLGPSFGLYDKKKQSNIKSYIKKLIKWRFSSTKNAYLGKIPAECKNCIELNTTNISLKDYLSVLFNLKKFPIKTFIIKPFRQCEFSCVYCLEKKYTKGKKTLTVTKSDFYEFLPILQEFQKNKLIDVKDAEFSFHGGSISVWDEFVPILNSAYKHGIKNFTYLTNAAAFIPEIANYARTTNSTVIVSLDCGTKETFKLIKGADEFDTVKENILKYHQAGVNCGLKYILLKNINDNLEEVSEFLNFVEYLKRNTKANNCVSVIMDVDYRDILKEDYVMPTIHKEIIKYVMSWGEKNKTFVNMQDHVRKLI